MPNVLSPHFVSAGANITTNLAIVAKVAGFVPLTHWDFTDISTLWQDANRTNAITADGQAILGVTDKGTAQAHLGPNPTNGPRYTTAGINSLSTADFDDTNSEGLLSTAIDITDDYAFLFVGELDATIGATGRGLNPGTSGNMQIQGTSTLIRVMTAEANALQQLSGSGIFAGYGTTNGTANLVSLNVVAGQVAFNGASAGIPVSTIGVGAQNNGTAFWRGFVSEIVIWDAGNGQPLPSAIETYVTNRYGLTWL